MSDESPRDASPAHEPGPADEPTVAGEPTAAGESAAAAGPPPPPPPPGEPPGRRGVWVPRWAAFVAGAVVAVLVLFFGGFAIGRTTSDGDSEEGGERRTEQEFPRREEPGEARPRSGVFLGVATRDATGDVQGAEIVAVAEGSPAAEAGLQEGDIVTDVDGTAITNASDLREQVRSRESGDQVTITYTRDGNSAQAQVTLGDSSTESTPSA
jgi:membrane-associated protease RseP (regulator of RpoE activity)